MLKLAWRGVRYNTGRYIATLVAIMTGVGFFAATGFLGDRVIESLEGDTQRQFGEVAVAVVVEEAEDDEVAQFSDEAALPAAVAEQVVGLDGVDGHAFVLSGPMALRGADGVVVAEEATGRLWIEDKKLNPVDIVEGRGPESSGEIAIDRGVASAHDLAVGDPTTALSIVGDTPATVVGITKFGESDALDGGGTIHVSSSDGFAWLSGGNQEYEAVYLRAGLLTDQQALAEAARALLPAGFMAETGEKFIESQAGELASIGKALKQGLQGFAMLALFVGGFVIYNTFSVLVAQRLKELAVLRALGATPKQVRRALRYEGLVVGLLGSVLGILAGIVLVFIIGFVLERFGVSLPGSGLVIKSGVVTNALFLGTVITVLSVMIPARRAARTEPIEALRDAAVEVSPYTRGRLIFTSVTAIVGLTILFVGTKALHIGLGLLLSFVAAIAAGPILAVMAAKATKPVMSRFGLEGRLASDNLARNPTRTATTANALLIGVFLVTFISVAGVSIKDWVVDQIKTVESADFLLASDGGSLDDELVSGIRAVEDVETVEPFRREFIAVDGSPSLVSSVNVESILAITDIKVSAGSLDDLKPGTVAVGEETGLALGDTSTFEALSGESRTLEVVAILAESFDQAQTGNIVDGEDFDVLVGATAPTVAFIDVAAGAKTETTEALETFAAGRPDLQLQEGNTIGKLIGTIFDFVINAVNGLLGMSVLVAVIGIINTLTLSIFERRRELGLIRVVGMLDSGVRRMIRLESILISTLGTVTGMVLGFFFGWMVIRSVSRLSDADIPLALAGGRLALVLLAGIVFGVLASLIPANRSTKLDVLEAIQA